MESGESQWDEGGGSRITGIVEEKKGSSTSASVLCCPFCRGILPEHKPELQRVLEARRIKQLKQQEETQKPLTDLEEELRKRQQKLDQVFIICSPVSFSGCITTSSLSYNHLHPTVISPYY